jgi:hypothetical protein
MNELACYRKVFHPREIRMSCFHGFIGLPRMEGAILAAYVGGLQRIPAIAHMQLIGFGQGEDMAKKQRFFHPSLLSLLTTITVDTACASPVYSPRNIPRRVHP